MSRYIKADDLKKEMDELEGWFKDLKWKVENLEAEVKPVIHGEWIKEGDNCVMGDGFMWHCSICGERVYFDTNGNHDNYCRCCGSDMRGGRNEQIH